MRRTERLFELVQLIRGRRLSTAAWLAERLGVSVRTVYRAIADLQAQGVPIEGEAGVGYRLGSGYELPPLMFSSAQAQALVAAIRVAAPRLDERMARDAEDALGRILAVMPTTERTAADRLALFVPPHLHERMPGREALAPVRLAIDQRRKLRLAYRDAAGQDSQRVVRPLGCFCWDAVWTLAAWCETRDDFRHFRLDRMAGIDTLDETFRDEPGRTLADFLRRIKTEGRSARKPSP
jgi:predicted DNA-binding transcriptional regulator YafY